MDTPPILLVDSIATFLERHNMSPVTFGRSAMKDPHFVKQLRAGRRVWPETEDRARKFMAEYAEPASTAEAA
jgi:2,4-dienoyl-CoA reductase-like NADH-dependent reductase (Old Yellow Enzyme family)